jgi:hypothetical protein
MGFLDEKLECEFCGVLDLTRSNGGKCNHIGTLAGIE